MAAELASIYAALMATLVMTLIGTDQAGLVDAVAGTIAEHGGNWEESHLFHHNGIFAGIVVAKVNESAATDLTDALRAITATGMLSIAVETTTDQDPIGDMSSFSLSVVGQDRPGIIHDISHALARHNVSIASLESSTSSAPMAGGTLFEATVELLAPANLSEDELVDTVRDLADRLMVDIELADDLEQ